MFINLNNKENQAIVDQFFKQSKCERYAEKRIVLFGPPGSGKGTQSQRLVSELCSCHISTGDLLRKEIREKTDLGMKAKDIMNRGDLVPDELVLDILNKKLQSDECKTGAVFDGFPRTVNQAQKLDDMLAKSGQKIDAVLNFEVDESTLVERISGRRVHEASGRSYHVVFNPPKTAGVDDVTGEPLIQRKDDQADTVKTRLSNYNQSTIPVLDYYTQKGNLFNFNAKKNIDDVWADISTAILQ